MWILVTGGAGFIGSHMVDELAGRGHEVLVLDRLHPWAHAGRPSYLRDDVEYLDGGLEPEALDRALDSVAAICHQAGWWGSTTARRGGARRRPAGRGAAETGGAGRGGARRRPAGALPSGCEQDLDQQRLCQQQRGDHR